jgi:hypothetical protein
MIWIHLFATVCNKIKALVLACSVWIAAFSFCCLGYFGLMRVAQADCYQLFQRQQYEKAASCFVDLAQTMGTPTTTDAKIRKGRLLRNAAMSLDRAAKGNDARGAAIQRSNALGLLGRYLSEQLYESESQRKATEDLMAKMREQIGYARLVIVTNHQGAKICVHQEKASPQCQTGMLWETRLLPQTYQIEVTYPLDPPVSKRQTFEALPRTDRTLVFTPPIKQQGLLSIVTDDPQADITISGSNLKVPLTHRGANWSQNLMAGNYEVVIAYPGQAAMRQTFAIATGKPTILLFRKPGPPVLIVNTTPINAQVFIDGKYHGNTGLKLNLQPGVRQIELRRGCYQIIKRTLTMEANREYVVSEILQRDPVYLQWQNTSKGPNTKAIAGWSAMIAGVLLAGTAGIMHGLASSRQGDALNQRAYNFTGYKQLADEGNLYRTVGHTGIAIGTVGIGVGVGFILAARPQSRYDLACQIPIQKED